jgi:hypothetical protein
MNNLSQKYTLSLPTEIYEELKTIADKHDTSIKDVVRQCLKFGLIAMKLDGDSESTIIFRERIKKGEDEYEYKDTTVRFML